MTSWYYADAQNNRHGPVSAEDLRTLHAGGKLRPDTLVWREGLDGWKPWREVQHEVIVARPDAPPPVPPESAVAAAAVASPYAPPRAPLHDEHAVHSGGHVVYAGFWKRAAASFIDSFVTTMAVYAILIPLTMLSGAGLGAFAGNPDAMSGGAVAFMGLFYLISRGIPMLYLSWMHSSSSQATLGKMAVGIKVTRTDGERISFLRAFGRYFGYVLSSMLMMIGLIMAAFTERKQALHDMMCDTLVVDKHAFTANPELQSEDLGGVTIAVLVLAGLMVLGMFLLIGFVIFAAASGGWR